MLFPRLNLNIDEAIDEIQKNLGKLTNEDLDGAKLIDNHTYKVEDEDYEQKVYRLPDHSIYVETRPLHTTSLERLQYRLKKAIHNESYDEAGRIKRLIDRLKTK